MEEPFRQSLPGEPAAIDAAGAWMDAIVRTSYPALAGLAVRAVRSLVTEAIRHTPAGEQVLLEACPADDGMRIEVRDPGASRIDDASEEAWAELSREVEQFGSTWAEGEGHLAWVLLTWRT
jgi:hypothetical protein